MLLLEQIVKKLNDRNIREVARRTGIHFNTVYSIVNGKKKNPSYEVVRKLSEYLED